MSGFEYKVYDGGITSKYRKATTGNTRRLSNHEIKKITQPSLYLYTESECSIIIAIVKA